MIAVIQLVQHASVSLSSPKKEAGIKYGLQVFLGISRDDTQKEADMISAKILKLRIFPDQEQKMNLDCPTAHGEILLIPQFTLLGNLKGNNRPDFSLSADKKYASNLFDYVAGKLSEIVPVKKGFFGEYMQIESFLIGPVTIIIDTDKL